jgi:hypothetical protein
MRGLVFYCRTFCFELVEKTAAAWQDEAGRTGAVENSVVVFVAVEEGDTESQISPFAKEVRRWCRKSRAGCVVLNPYCHLTAAPAHPDLASDLSRLLLARLCATLEMPVTLTSFGWTKSFACDVIGDRSSQGWIEIPAGARRMEAA